MVRVLTPEQITAEADRLIVADRDHLPAPLLSDRFPEADVTDAYRISEVVAARRIRVNDSVVGYKVGLTSEAVRAMAGIDEPDFGIILESRVYKSGATILRKEVFDPGLEPELAFRLRSALRGPGIKVEDVAAATAEVIPCLEIVDSRYAGRARLVDSIADNASSHAIVLAGRGVPLTSLDLPRVTAELAVNGRTQASGVGKDVMGNPAAAVAWLANKLADFGVALEAGHVVLSGSMSRIVYLKDFAGVVEAVADFGRLGRVGVTLSESEA